MKESDQPMYGWEPERRQGDHFPQKRDARGLERSSILRP